MNNKIIMKKDLLLVCSAVFVLVIGTGIVAPLLTPYAETLNATGIEIGLLFSGFYIVRILAGTHIGKLADRVGAKAILRYSLILYPFIGVAYICSSNYFILFGARLLHGLASAMMLPMVMTYIGGITPIGKEGKYMGIYNTVLFIANSVGPLIGGVISSNFGYRKAFSSLLFLSLISLVIVCFLPNVEGSINKKTKTSSSENIDTKVWKDPELLAIAIINILDSILAIFIVTFYVLYLGEKGIGGIAFIGLLVTINNSIIGVTQIPIAKIVDKFDRGVLTLTSGLSIIITIVLLQFTANKAVIITLFIILSIGSSIILSASSALSTMIGREKGMGKVMGFLGSATSLGAVIGPIILGAFKDYISIDSTFKFLLISWVIGMIMFKVFYKKRETLNLETENKLSEQ